MKAKIKKAFFYGSWLMKFSLLTTFFLIVSIPLRFSKKYKDLWLISERPDEARDNGYWLYKWILENKPETNIRYVLAKKSADYKKMPRKDLIIEPGSAKHYIYWILSKYSVSTHMHGACPGKSFCIPFLPFARHKKTIFLQHGVTQNMINLRGGLDIITAVSENEKQLLIKSNPRYKNNIVITGFCRYDSLADESKEQKQKIILVMPTFRKWLRDIARLKDANEVFKKTKYYKAWNSFLNDEQLSELLKENNLKLVFFPHNEMQDLAQNFKANSKRITIGKRGEFDIQALLKKSSVLITDYSSVYFDFVYMNKPVTFYQFDQEDFYAKHYSGTGKKTPFGETFIEKSGLIDSIANIVKNGFSVEKKYKKEKENFFKYNDMQNCERVYDSILDIKNNASISKTINYVWFGGNELPKDAKKCIESWKKYMPDYSIIEWNEKNFDIYQNKYLKEAYLNKQFAFASDYARLKILHDNGGIYFDTDVELIKPVPEEFMKTGFLAKEDKKHINTGLGFACEKGDRTIKRMLDDYEDISFIKKNGKFDKTSCPKRNTKSVRSGLKSNIIILESDYMNPYCNKTGLLNTTSRTFSIHHYGSSWLSESDKKRKEQRYLYVKKHGKTLGLLRYRLERIPSKILGGDNE